MGQRGALNTSATSDGFSHSTHPEDVQQTGSTHSEKNLFLSSFKPHSPQECLSMALVSTLTSNTSSCWQILHSQATRIGKLLHSEKSQYQCIDINCGCNTLYIGSSYYL